MSEEFPIEENIEPEGEESTPEYAFGDFTSDEVAERLGYVRSLPEHLRGMESRVESQVTPVMEQLRGIQEKLGSQNAFDPKLETVQKVLAEYDPALAEKLLPALAEDLKNSMQTTPLGPEALQPFVDPMMEERQSALMQQIVPAMLESLPFDSDAVVKRDPSTGEILPPETELQKQFYKWWEQADAPTHKALENPDIGFVRAMSKFGKWRAEQLGKEGETAGAASDRLAAGTQIRSGGKQHQRPAKTLEDEFNAGAQAVLAEYGRA